MSASRRADYKKSGVVVRNAPARSSVGSNRKMTVAVPGVTRTGGAYARAVMSRYGQEGKYLDVKVNADAYANTFTQAGLTVPWKVLSSDAVCTLTQISQGTSAHQRIGNKIRPYQIRFRGYINFISTHPIFARVLLVEDRQANGTLPAMTDMLVAGSDGHYLNAFYNMDNIARFRFLKDKIVKMDSLSSQILAADQAIGHVYVQPFKMSHKIKGNPLMEYSSTTGATAEVRSINYLMVIISNESSSTANASRPTLTGHARFYFKE